MKYYLSIQNSRIVAYLNPTEENYEKIANSVAIECYCEVALTSLQFQEITSGIAYDFIDGIPQRHIPTDIEIDAELRASKESKVEKVVAYDQSNAVNQFFLADSPMWLNKETRVGLMNSINIEKSAGRTQTNLWFNGVSLSFPIEQATGMLTLLELYALDCYNATQRHIVAVNDLTTKEDIEAYDFTSGYPDKLIF